MTYEAWRISFQSSEQAARSAYDQLSAARARIEELERENAELLAKLEKFRCIPPPDTKRADQ